MSPITMIGVMASAITPTSMTELARLDRLSGVRKNGDEIVADDEQPYQDRQQQHFPTGKA